MFERPRIKGAIFIETMEGQYNSLDENRYAQVFANWSFFADAYPMEKKVFTGQGLRWFIVNSGVMDRLVFDGSK